MSRRAIHFEPDVEAENLFRGTRSEFERQHLTSYADHITCKRCPKILARDTTRRAKEIQLSEASARDSINDRVKQIVYTDPRDALCDLCRRKGLPLFTDV